MAIKRIRYKNNPLKVNRTAQEKLATFGTTREDGDRYMAEEYAKSFETFGPAVRGTATIPDEPQDMLAVRRPDRPAARCGYGRGK